MPTVVKKLLTICGYNHAWAFKDVDNEKVTQLESFIETRHRKVADSFEEYGEITPFEFLPGHRDLIFAIKTQILSFENSKKPKPKSNGVQTHVPDGNELKNNLINQVASYSLSLPLQTNQDWSNAIGNFKFTTDGVSTSAECTLSCPFCNAVRVIRYDGKYWATSNIYKHIRTHIKTNEQANGKTDGKPDHKPNQTITIQRSSAPKSAPYNNSQTKKQTNNRKLNQKRGQKSRNSQGSQGGSVDGTWEEFVVDSSVDQVVEQVVEIQEESNASPSETCKENVINVYEDRIIFSSDLSNLFLVDQNANQNDDPDDDATSDAIGAKERFGAGNNVVIKQISGVQTLDKPLDQTLNGAQDGALNEWGIESEESSQYY